MKNDYYCGMKQLFIIFSCIVFAACNANQSTENTNNVDENAASESTTETTAEEAPEAEAEPNNAELILGTWEFEDPKLKVTQIITYNEDGTYQMKMASIDVSGTWELDGDVLTTKSRPDAPGQKKTITKLDEDNLWTNWEPAGGGEARELKYVKKK